MKHLFLILALGSFTSSAHAAPYSYATHALQLTDLGAGVTPNAINNVGQVVGQVVGQAANDQAFLWSNGTLTPLGTLGGSQSVANDVNDSGVVVGWSSQDAGGMMKAFKWDVINGMVNIGAASTLESVAEAVNNDGEIVGWRTNGTVIRSAEWTDAIPQGTSLFAAENGNHKVLGIDSNGNIVGLKLDGFGVPIASFYFNGQGSNSNFTETIATSGYIVGGINDSKYSFGSFGMHAAILALGSENLIMIDKLNNGDDFAAAYGLNDLGLMVGESGSKGIIFDISTDVLLDINAFTRLTPGFGQILRLNDIGNDDQFVGIVLVDGVEHGFVGQLVPVPEPSSWILLSVALAVMSLFRKTQS